MKLYMDEGCSLTTMERGRIMRPVEGWRCWANVENGLRSLSRSLADEPAFAKCVRIFTPDCADGEYDVEWGEDLDPPRPAQIVDLMAQLTLGRPCYESAIGAVISLAAHVVTYPSGSGKTSSLKRLVGALRPGSSFNPAGRKIVDIHDLARQDGLPEIILRGGSLPPLRWLP